MKHHNIINVVDKAYLKHDVDLIIYLIHIAYFYFNDAINYIFTTSTLYRVGIGYQYR